MNLSDFTHSAYIAGLLGGLLIGIAAALFVLLNGRIAGISGILAGLLQADKGDKTWRVLFLLGMAVAPFVYQIASDLPSVTIEAAPLTQVRGGKSGLQRAG